MHDRRVDWRAQIGTTLPQIIFRKGFDLKSAVEAELAAAYHSGIVDQVRHAGHVYQSGRLTLHLATEFGFCYGVDRAVDYAYQTRRKFPDKRVFLTGEIIHNPHVNDQLRARGIRILTDPGEDRLSLGQDDVVILPAFGVSVGELAQLEKHGCTL
ncbi:MAG: 4-hydroxy-3-methylbut-2-enyl diphosphate reductase, partial [Acidobacteriota bacterium]